MWQLPNYVQYRLELQKQSKVQKELDKKRPAESRQSHESGEQQYYDMQDEELYEWKRLIQTRYYRNKADSLLVPMPGFDEDGMYERVEWDRDSKQPRYLTDKGLRVVRSAIREEQKHRRESVGYWFGILAGLIGAITGLVSVFKS